MAIYYLDGQTLSDSTSVFTDPELTTCAPDGYYSNGVIARRQFGCELLPEEVCPACIWNTVPDEFESRVLSDGGSFEGKVYLVDFLKDIPLNLFNDASLIVTPNGFKASKLYSLKPFDGSGDLTVLRNTSATRVNESGLIELVGNNVPRLDWSSGEPSILVEPQRTNLVTYSEDFDAGNWEVSGATIDNDTVISPDGTQSADTLTTSVAGGTTQQTLTVNNGVTTFSVFVKKGTTGGVRLRIDAATDCNGYFDLTNNTVFSSSDDASIESYGNGWYRVSISANITSFVKVSIYTTNGTTAYENGTLNIWGAQLEQGDLTSYIPTSGSVATRNYDYSDYLDITQFNIGNSYTLFFEIELNPNDPNAVFFNANTSSNSFSFQLRCFSQRLRLYDRIDAKYPLGSLLSSNNKYCLRIDGNSYTLFTQGQINNATLITARDLGYFEFTGQTTSFKQKSLMIFPRALTDAECQSLTN